MRVRPKWRIWTKEENEILREMYPDYNVPIETIAKIFNRTVKSTECHAHQLGIKRRIKSEIDYGLLESVRKEMEEGGEVQSI